MANYSDEPVEPLDPAYDVAIIGGGAIGLSVAEAVSRLGADRVVVLSNGRLIAAGTVAEIRSVVARKQITCSSALSPDDVALWPGVLAVTESSRRLRITALLVRVRDDTPLWSDRFDRDSTDVLNVHDEISRGIVNSLRLNLGRGRRRGRPPP